MGVPGLWKILEPVEEIRPFVEFSSAEGFMGTPGNDHGRRMAVIGVDISLWLWQVQRTFQVGHSQAGPSPELRTLFNRMARLYREAVLVILVFDGVSRPPFKRNKTVSMRPHWLTPQVQEMATIFGFSWYTAPGEAEAELAYLNRIGIIDAILTDDGDAFLFGASYLIRNPSIKTEHMNITTYDAAAIKNNPQVQLTRGGMILIALLAGGDYNTEGIEGCGAHIAHKVAVTGMGDSLLDAALQLPPFAFNAYLDNWRDELRILLSTNPDNLLGRKYVNLADAIPDTFPEASLVLLYASPVTSGSLGTNAPDFSTLNTTRPDLPKLAEFCRTVFKWTDISNAFNTRIWPGCFLRMLFKSDPVYDLVHRLELDVFNASSVLKIVRTKKNSRTPQYYIRTSTSILTKAVTPTIPSDDAVISMPATFSGMYIPAVILEHALPEMVNAYKNQAHKGKGNRARTAHASSKRSNTARATVLPAASSASVDVPLHFERPEDAELGENAPSSPPIFAPSTFRGHMVVLNGSDPEAVDVARIASPPSSNFLGHIDLTLDDSDDEAIGATSPRVSTSLTYDETGAIIVDD